MNARKEFKRLFHPRFMLAATQLRLAALVDAFVANWLARCAANAEAAQRLFTSDRKPARGFPDRRGPRRFLAALE